MPTLHWIGKDKVVNHHHDVPFHILDKKYSFPTDLSGFENLTGLNKIIHGDNLLALKALLPEYEGKIKCIYIDPPYNTGNENWVYNDNVNHPQIKKWLGQVVGREAEDLTRHDKWLCMMYPRLKLLHKLLADDGAIFISIDDNEVSHLRLIMDEVFGSGNFRNHIIIKRGTKSVQAQFDSIDKLGIACEHLVCYSKNISYKLPQFYFDLEEAKEGTWNNHWRGTDRPTMRYEIFGITPEEGQWRWGKQRSEIAIENYKKCENDIKNKNRVVNQKNIDDWYLLNAIEKEIDLLRLSKNNKPEHYIAPTDKKFGHNLWTDLMVNGTSEYNKYSEIKFDNPKNSKIIERIFKWVGGKSDIILDSFAGSGTTAHAVINLNKADGGNRKFILVEMEDYAENITAERVRRVGGEFDFYELGLPLFEEDGNLNEKVPTEKIREYIYFMETKALPNMGEAGYFLGKHSETAYYFYYEKESQTNLDYDFLSTIKIKAEQYVIYADNCLLTKAYMLEKHIIFKKIPRDISKL
ncbi:MAG: site-specific DNA-methyltransferase [Cytophagales bacterium]|nr:MAG: site-specific DNA-methyltransferase [Cytophagales bacterium]